MKTLMLAVMTLSTVVLAAPPPTPAPRLPKEQREERRVERRAERERTLRMFAVVGIAEALELNEADALKLSDKLKGFAEKKRPVHEQMFEAMKTLRAAADGDAAAVPQVDQALQRVLDGRAQLAALDKEMFNALALGQSPQKKAKLALFMAKFGQERQRLHGAARGEHDGRRSAPR